MPCLTADSTVTADDRLATARRVTLAEDDATVGLQQRGVDGQRSCATVSRERSRTGCREWTCRCVSKWSSASTAFRTPEKLTSAEKGLLKDDKTLVGDYGFKSGSAVHVVRGVGPASSTPSPAAAAAPARAAAPAPAPATPLGLGLGGFGLGGFGLGGMPGGLDFNAMQRQMQEQMAANPGMMEQMLNSPAMQSLMQNPEAISAMIQSNPQMRALMEQNPELRSVLSDPNLMRQSLEAARNPALRAELTRNTDRAMANIEGMPGGYNALAHMYQTGESNNSQGIRCCMCAYS